MEARHVYEVTAQGDLWAVRGAEADEAMSVHETRAEAIEEANAWATEHIPSTVRIFYKNGTLDHEYYLDGAPD